MREHKKCFSIDIANSLGEPFRTMTNEGSRCRYQSSAVVAFQRKSEAKKVHYCVNNIPYILAYNTHFFP